jgi:hypothetical protein
MQSSMQLLANAFLEFQWVLHVICILLLIFVRIFRERGFKLILTAVILFVVALGNAMLVEQFLLAPTAISENSTLGLKAVALFSLVVYGAIAANLVVVAITSDGRTDG